MKGRSQLYVGLLLLAVLSGWPRPATQVRSWLLAGQRSASTCPPVQGTPYFTYAYGTLTVDGASAPVGMVVEARSPRGDVAGCFKVTAAGNYGMMYIYGEDTTVTPTIPGMRAGETVAFYVNGSPATAAPVLTWVNDKSWHEVNLEAVGILAADFSGTPRQGPAPLSVNFTNLSAGNYTTCAWTFGDGGTSASCANPIHPYVTPGTYNVSLTVSGALGSNTETKNGYITVHTPLKAQFSAAPTTGIVPLTVSFTNSSTGDYTTCTWNFGDGITSTLTSPPHTYTSEGSYTVSLTIRGLAGEDTATRIDLIQVRQSYMLFLPLVLRVS